MTRKTGRDNNKLSSTYCHYSQKYLDLDISGFAGTFLAKNIGLAYREAEPQIKRSYIDLFFNYFLIKEGDIVSFSFKDNVKELIPQHNVRLSTNGYPRQESNLQPCP